MHNWSRKRAACSWHLTIEFAYRWITGARSVGWVPSVSTRLASIIIGVPIRPAKWYCHITYSNHAKPWSWHSAILSSGSNVRLFTSWLLLVDDKHYFLYTSVPDFVAVCVYDSIYARIEVNAARWLFTAYSFCRGWLTARMKLAQVGLTRCYILDYLQNDLCGTDINMQGPTIKVVHLICGYNEWCHIL